ncbi:hypothetical protein E2C01_022216 [Portunus trituberculatus]|uniref:Uncharacterized protein n=1 Tax=Portunus trituberculatus TaxID=210409 RepID=A0A5B7E4T0_PORTR|nr:hypothetical protein [Portunus trituberculatus]
MPTLGRHQDRHLDSLSAEKKVEGSGKVLRKGSGNGIGFVGETAVSNNITKSGGLRRVASGSATLTTSAAWWTLAHNSLHITLCLPPSLYTLGSTS